MAYDEGLAERVREILSDHDTLDEKKMFGGLAFMLDGYMCCGITDERLMVRVGKDKHDEALSEPHVAPMDFTGRPMKGYVYVAPEGIEADNALAKWVNMGVAFVKTLPPKT